MRRAKRGEILLLKTFPCRPVKVFNVIKIVDKKSTSYKIGRTKNLNRRMKEHLRTIPGKLELVLYEMFDENEFLEVCIHSFLSKYRKQGKLTEIFETDLNKIINLIKICRDFRMSEKV